LALPAKQGFYRLTLVVDGYKPYQNDTLIDGSIDNVINIELERISYAVRVSFLNKPNYMTDDVIEFSAGSYVWVNNRPENDKCLLTILASSTVANTPDKILATGVMRLDSYVPQISLSGISLPSWLKLQLSGYTTMWYQIPTLPNLQGVIELNIDLTSAYVLAHQIKIPVRLDVWAKQETVASNQIQLSWNDQAQVRALDQLWGPDTLQNIELQIKNLPCGYVIPFDVQTDSLCWDYINSIVVRGRLSTTNYYYLEPVRVTNPSDALNQTTTAHLMISRTNAMYPSTPGGGAGGGS